MAIDFGSLGGDSAATSASNTTPSPKSNTISLDMSKGDILDLAKDAPGLTRGFLAGGWDASAYGDSADLDLFGLMLNKDGKLVDGGNSVVYFKNKKHPGVELGEDNRTGAGDGDDERMSFDFPAIPANVDEIVVGICIFDAAKKRQTFGMIKNAFVRLVNSDNNNEACKFRLTDDYSTDTYVIAGFLKRSGSNWTFTADGTGGQGDLIAIANKYA